MTFAPSQKTRKTSPSATVQAKGSQPPTQEHSKTGTQLLELRSMMHNNPQAAAQRAMQSMINSSAVAQKKALQRFGRDARQADIEEEEEPLQGKFESAPRPDAMAASQATFGATTQGQSAPNHTGLPDQLKTGIESLSGIGMDHVRVHYNSARPAQLNAHAYTQGSEIHVAQGQERHVPHEAWHVVQQAQGRVRPTRQMKGKVAVNNDAGLEKEADVMGAAAARLGGAQGGAPTAAEPGTPAHDGTCQMAGAGGEKIGFDKASSADEATAEEIRKGFALLQAAWKEARATRKEKKKAIGENMGDYDDRQKELNDLKKDYPLLTKYGKQSEAGSEQAEYARQNNAYSPKKKEIVEKYKKKTAFMKDNAAGQSSLTQVYYKELVPEIEEEAELLKKSAAFSSGQLTLNADQIIYKSDKGDIPIATLKRGNDAFHQSATNEERELFSKTGLESKKTAIGDKKEYIKDNLGTFTRRYAFVEKNYYQMMEFFMTDHMTGRFQQYMMSGGDKKPGIHKITTNMIKNVPSAPSPQLSDTQVAVAHQMYGSLPEQRGVSLTATPKVGVTYANTGGNFRTDDGFKLKIDLARIPKDVLLLNHYSQGGVSDMAPPDYSTTQTHKAKPYNYKYKESALHARELFLEHIRPEWVVEIEHHKKGGFKERDGEKEVLQENDHKNLLSAAKEKFGGDAYEKGFETGVSNGSDVTKLKNDPNYTKGKATGKMVASGYSKGIVVTSKKGIADSHHAFIEVMEDPSIQDQMSPFHVGYLQARTGQPLITTSLEFRSLLNTEFKSLLNSGEKLSDTSASKTSYLITNDQNNFIIKVSFPGPMQEQKTKTTSIPFMELRDAKISYEPEEKNVEVTIKRRSGDFSISLSKEQSMRFQHTVDQYIKSNSKLITTEEKSSEKGTHGMSIDAESLKIERQFVNNMGTLRTKNSIITLAAISGVEFKKEDSLVEITVEHASGSYEMSVKPQRAAEIRQLLIRNGINPAKLGALPMVQ